MQINLNVSFHYDTSLLQIVSTGDIKVQLGSIRLLFNIHIG